MPEIFPKFLILCERMLRKNEGWWPSLFLCILQILTISYIIPSHIADFSFNFNLPEFKVNLIYCIINCTCNLFLELQNDFQNQNFRQLGIEKKSQNWRFFSVQCQASVQLSSQKTNFLQQQLKLMQVSTLSIVILFSLIFLVFGKYYVSDCRQNQMFASKSYQYP